MYTKPVHPQERIFKTSSKQLHGRSTHHITWILPSARSGHEEQAGAAPEAAVASSSVPSAAAGASAARKAAASPGSEALKHTELTIQDAVLCSEMGVHFSPCGRYLAACVACQVSLFMS